jgi:hypothetical protein
MEKVPQEVQRILDNIVKELDALSALTRHMRDFDDHLKVVDRIDDIRKKLSLLDMNYDDCYAILVGFLKYQAEKRMSNIKTQEQNNDKQSNG